MFTGIVQGAYPIKSVKRQEHLLSYGVQLPIALLKGLEIGASVSVDGVCQTVVRIEDSTVFFDAIEETLVKTNLNKLQIGQLVNIERSLRFGDEVGGHLLSGHIYGQVKLVDKLIAPNYHELRFHFPAAWHKYFFRKGYIALNGVSLTIGDVGENHTLSVHLIPETLNITNLKLLKVGDLVNVELDTQTQVIVETLERILPHYLSQLKG